MCWERGGAALPVSGAFAALLRPLWPGCLPAGAAPARSAGARGWRGAGGALEREVLQGLGRWQRNPLWATTRLEVPSFKAGQHWVGSHLEFGQRPGTLILTGQALDEEGQLAPSQGPDLPFPKAGLLNAFAAFGGEVLHIFSLALLHCQVAVPKQILDWAAAEPDRVCLVAEGKAWAIARRPVAGKNHSKPDLRSIFRR